MKIDTVEIWSSLQTVMQHSTKFFYYKGIFIFYFKGFCLLKRYFNKTCYNSNFKFSLLKLIMEILDVFCFLGGIYKLSHLLHCRLTSFLKTLQILYNSRTIFPSAYEMVQNGV